MPSDYLKTFDPCRQGFHENCATWDQGQGRACACGCHGGLRDVLDLRAALAASQAREARLTEALAETTLALGYAHAENGRMRARLENVLEAEIELGEALGAALAAAAAPAAGGQPRDGEEADR